MSPDRDPYGRTRFINMIMSGQFAPFDVLWFLLDHFSLAQPVNVNNQAVPFIPAVVQLARSQGRKFKVVQYIPVDSEQVRPEWINWIPGTVDVPVAYTQFGARVLTDLVPALADKMRVIPHGTNPELFYPLPPAEVERFRREQLKVPPGGKLIVNVNRNQPRKDVVRTIQMFDIIRKEIPDARLYCHMNVMDSMGYNLDQLRQNLQIPAHMVMFPANFNEGVGYPIPALNMIYNAADLIVNTARGEGWSLTTSEAMCVGKPVLAPDHTSFSELLADGRGILVPPEAQRQIIIADNDQLRPVADVPAMADKALWALQHPEEANAIGQHGREWALKLSWHDTVAPMWRKVFEECDPARRPVAQPAQRRLTFNTPRAAA